MKIGVCRKCVSTSLPVKMSGFGNPNRKYLGTHDDLYVTTLALEDGGATVAFVAADVLGFDSITLAEMESEIIKRTGLSLDHIVFNASHTHSAPETSPRLHPHIGGYLKEYADFFYDSVIGSVAGAIADLEDGRLFFGTGDCYGIGINRRLIKDETYYFAPNEDGVRNDEVTVLKAECGGKVKAVLFQFACHPSTIGLDYASADFPGVARRIVEAAYPGATALFMQGCCGNIRTRTIKDEMHFGPGSYEYVETFGALLADTVKNVTSGGMQELTGPVACKKISFGLPLRRKAPKDYYEKKLREAETPYEKAGYETYVNGYDSLPDEAPYSLQAISIGSAFTFVALPGEVVVEYDCAIKQMLPGRHTAVMGYTNGSPGYICTEGMYKYGGYEPDRSVMVYLLVEGYEPANEQIILEKARELLSGV